MLPLEIFLKREKTRERRGQRDFSGEYFLGLRLLWRGGLVPRMGADWFCGGVREENQREIKRK